MPLTEFQERILKLIAKNRSLDSHIGGGLVLNAAEDSLRFSKDVDIFHEAAVEVVKASEADATLLEKEGYEVETNSGDWERPTTFRKARVRRHGQEVEIDWVADAAVRFFRLWRMRSWDGGCIGLMPLRTRSWLWRHGRSQGTTLIPWNWGNESRWPPSVGRLVGRMQDTVPFS